MWKRKSKSRYKIDINNKITGSINLGQLDANTKQDFLAKLQIELVKMTDLASIIPSDYIVYKAGAGSVAIIDDDITASNSLKIKISAEKGTNFEGEKDDITVNYIQKDTTTDLKDIINSDLGKIRVSNISIEKPTIEQIQDKLPSTIDMTQINIVSIDTSSAIVKPIDNSTKYINNTVTVNFTLIKPCDSLILTITPNISESFFMIINDMLDVIMVKFMNLTVILVTKKKKLTWVQILMH